MALFAAAFFGLPVILVPQGQSYELLIDILRETKADFLIAPAGTVPENLRASNPALKHIIWVVEETSRQLGWLEDHDSSHASEWHKIVDAKKNASTEIPVIDSELEPAIVSVVWQNKKPDDYQIVEFSQNVKPFSSQSFSRFTIRRFHLT